MKSPVIGIDLGTTYSCVAVFQNDKVEIIANEQAKRKTPSFVAFAENEILVGEDAKNRGAKYSENTVFDSKRLLGKQLTDEKVQHDMGYWPFKVSNSASPDIEVKFQENTRKLQPEVITSMILKKMKLDAEAHLGRRVSDTVISVPNYFTESQRQLVRESCELSGLNVIKLTSETSLVGLAFQFEKRPQVAKHVLVFDLGGGFLNTSVILIDKNRVEVKSILGGAHLGGRDFDNRLVKHFLDDFKLKNNIDLTSNKRAIYRLRQACEKVKHELSLTNKANIDLDALYEDIDFTSSITREKFEELNSDLFREMIEIVRKTLYESKLSKSQIDEIILVGGSTRVPKVQEILKEFFDGKELNKSINPDEAVAYGAAVQAALLTGQKSRLIQDLKMLDVVPITLGVETTGGNMASMIKSNTTFPTKVSRVFTTHHDNQSSVLVKLYEGEDVLTKNNSFIGSLELEGVAPAPKARPQIEITLEIDMRSMLSVSIVDRTNGGAKKITISGTFGLNKNKNKAEEKFKTIDSFKK